MLNLIPLKTHNLITLQSKLKNSFHNNSKTLSLSQLKQSHALALINGYLPQSISLSASLILHYAAHGHSNSCISLFRHAAPYSRTPFLWNTLIRAHSILGLNDGFWTYNSMIGIGIRPDDYTFPFVLKGCADYLEVKKGREAHGCVFKFGFDGDVFVGNTLLLFYGNCGLVRDAERVFGEMRERDVVSWNTVIGVFSVGGLCFEAVCLFRVMGVEFGVRPNLVSFVSVLPACAGVGDLGLVRGVHCFGLKVGVDCQVVVGNALVDAYAKCGSVKESKRVFDGMVERSEVSWNAVIAALAYAGKSGDAFDMFRMMVETGMEVNSVTMSSVLPVLVELGYLNLGKEIHGFSLRRDFVSDIFVSNSLIDLYAKLGCSNEAENVFRNMGERNIVSWNAMIANFSLNRLELAAVGLLKEMEIQGQTPNSVTFTNVLPACARLGYFFLGRQIHARAIVLGSSSDLFVSNALTDMYAKCGYLNHAKVLFDFSPRDEVSYNILIVAYSQSIDCPEALKLFSEMVYMGMNYDTVSFVGVISACANLAALKQGKEIHGLSIRKYLHLHLFVANSLSDFYIKCGKINIARMIFNRISKKDVASWNTMILGYGMLGDPETAISLYEEMKRHDVMYDSISYIAVLSACSHAGLVEKGKKYFEEMQAQDIKPTNMHYACMVDLFGRAGLLKNAVDLVKGLSISPDANIWGALVGACRIHGDLELGCWAAEHLLKLKPEHCGYHILLSNMYAEAGRWDEANRVRELMRLQGLKKNPACSWVQIHDQVHAYVAGERMEKLNQNSWIVDSC